MAKRDNLRGLLADDGDDQPLVRGRGVAGMFDQSQQADLSASQHDDLSATRLDDNLTNRQSDKPTNKRRSASQQADLTTNRHDDLPISQQADNQTRYIPAPFRLPAPLVKAMKVLAAQKDRSQQDLWEEAGRDFLARYGIVVD